MTEAIRQTIGPLLRAQLEQLSSIKRDKTANAEKVADFLEEAKRLHDLLEFNADIKKAEEYLRSRCEKKEVNGSGDNTLGVTVDLDSLEEIVGEKLPQNTVDKVCAKKEISPAWSTNHEVARDLRLLLRPSSKTKTLTFVSQSSISLKCRETNTAILSKYGVDKIEVKVIECFSDTLPSIDFDVTSGVENANKSVLKGKLGILIRSDNFLAML
uniref:Glutaredoxin domain-containing protein n=1 Tax=Syphacia muris TaxID=451379 RepID=A0A0N5ATP7_9BILA